MDPPTHSASSTAPQSVLTSLQSQIDALTEFSTRVPGLRQLPPLLLRTPGLDVGPDPAPGTLLETMKRVLFEATEMRKALLILHSPQDSTVAIGNATSIFVNAKHSKSFVALDGADHLLTRHEDAVYAADLIATWSERYLG